jgi:hypothetical protein
MLPSFCRVMPCFSSKSFSAFSSPAAIDCYFSSETALSLFEHEGLLAESARLYETVSSLIQLE